MNTRTSDVLRSQTEAEALLASSSGPDDIARAHLIFGVLQEHEMEWKAALDSYLRCLAAIPANIHTLYFGNNNLAYSLIQLGRYDEAEPYCIAAIKVDDHLHNAHKNLGLICQGQGRWLDAAFSFVKAYWLRRDNLRAYDHLNQLLAMKPYLAVQSPELAKNVDAIKKQVAEDGWVRIH